MAGRNRSLYYFASFFLNNRRKNPFFSLVFSLLLDLANATKSERQEKKTSVVEQLKTKPPKEKEKKVPQIGAEMER